MVTRNIKANTATQVNANLIGVLVHPNTYPPIVTVDDIVVDYTYTKVVVANGVPNPLFPGDYVEAITDTNNNVYYWVGNTTEIDGQIYYRWALWPTEGSIDDSVWTKDYPVYSGANLLKIDITDPEKPVITGEAGVVGAKFLNLNGEIHSDISFMQVNQYDLYNSNFSSTYQVGGDFLLDVQNGYKVGYVISGPSVVTDSDVTFIKGNTSGDYQTWTNNDYVSSGYGTRVLYTATDSPAVGDTALFTLNGGGEYNHQTIKAIDTTETPVDPDPVDCKLSYSVDGSTWNDWPKNMTDDNNVISNIPRYMYLKFSQDVVITEE